MKITAHLQMKYTAADQVAECMNVNQDTYEELWSVIVPMMARDAKALPQDHDSRVLRSIETTAHPLFNYWQHLTSAAQTNINEACSDWEKEVSQVWQGGA